MDTSTPYAAYIPSGGNPFLRIPLHVDFIRNDFSRNPCDEVTYVRLGSRPESRRRDSEFIASIPVYHPAGVHLDLTNWAGYLYLMLSQKDPMQNSFPSSLSIKRGCKWVKSYPSFGYYCFDIESNNGRFVILVDRPSTIRPTRSLKHATIIKSPFNRTQCPSPVDYNDVGIYLRRSTLPAPSTYHHDTYFASFKKTLDLDQIMSIYIKGTESLSLNKDMFHQATDAWDLKFHSIEGFQYFKSLDGEVIFTLQKDPVKKIFQAFLESIRKLVDREEIKKSGDLHKEYQMLLNYNVLQNDTTEAKTDLLKRCVETLEKFHIAE